MKKILLTMFIIIGIGVAGMSHAATSMTISVDGLEYVDDVEAFNLWADVSDDFSVIGPVFGNAIPPVPPPPPVEPPVEPVGWSIDANRVESNEYYFACSNQDAWSNLGIKNPMLNGVIATFEYEGTFNSTTKFQFGNFDGIEITGISLMFEDGNNIKFTGVPIPGAIFLFASGLLGLFGMRRKIKN